MLTAAQSDEVCAKVEAWRDAEWNARQPLLKRFRETPEECEIRVIEGPIPATTLEECVGSGLIEDFGRALEMLGREGRRFDTWLDTQPAAEVQFYRECRRQLP